MSAITEFDPSSHPHRRFNPLTEEYVLVSPHRAKRPWLGQVEPAQPASLPEYDPSCYLCPGNERAGGKKNSVFTSVFTFENDFAAVLPPPVPQLPAEVHPLLKAEPVHGRCDVLVFHPRHDLTLAKLNTDDILQIIEEWTRIYSARSSEDGVQYVQIFENKGAMMGCSNPHPHGQVWSLSTIPSIPGKELSALQRYASSHSPESDAPTDHGPCLLCEYAHFEVNGSNKDRIVNVNDHWVAVVPWWATWPFEILLLPYRRHVVSLADLSSDERSSLANSLSDITIRYDNLFSCSFAYSMGIHQAPIAPAEAAKKNILQDECKIAHLHFHFFPPLLRSASVRKFLVGFELMAESQRDLTPEQGASRLQACPPPHYRLS